MSFTLIGSYTKYHVTYKVYTNTGGIICPLVHELIQSLKIVDYLHVQANKLLLHSLLYGWDGLATYNASLPIASSPNSLDIFTVGGPRRGGGRGSWPPLPLKNHKNLEFLCNTGPDPLKNHKATKPEFNVGPSSARQRNAILMAFRWGADDGPLLVVFGSSLPSSKKCCQSWTPSDKTFWICTCTLQEAEETFSNVHLLLCHVWKGLVHWSSVMCPNI